MLHKLLMFTHLNYSRHHLLLLLLLLPAPYICSIPFICKIRIVNCSLRPDSVCCQDITNTTTTTSSPLPSAAEVVTEHENEPVGKDVVQAEPSQIDEVVVKITGEAIEVKSNATIPLSFTFSFPGKSSNHFDSKASQVCSKILFKIEI